MRTWVALIRGIGPATHRVMSMSALRAAAGTEGLDAVRTVLSTGNLVFRAEGGRADLNARVDRVIEGFGLHGHPAILRTAADLEGARDDCPFPEAARDRPSKLLAVFLSGAAHPDAARTLVAQAGVERLALRGQTLWIDYAGGVGRSALTAARIDRATGVAGTARNWNTLVRLIDETGR